MAPNHAGLSQVVVDALLVDPGENSCVLEMLGPFLEAAAQERLVLPHCGVCSTFHWYPADGCPRCGGEWVWRDVGSGGTVFSFSEVHHAFHPALVDATPYTVALIIPAGAPNVRLVSVVREADRPLAIGEGVLVTRGPRVGSGCLVAFRQLGPAKS